MRNFSYKTVGDILKELKKEGLSISRVTFYNLESDGLFVSRRSARGWRTYTDDEAELIKQTILQNYGIVSGSEREIMEQINELQREIEKTKSLA